jgi:hypothetical protein
MSWPGNQKLSGFHQILITLLGVTVCVGGIFPQSAAWGYPKTFCGRVNAICTKYLALNLEMSFWITTRTEIKFSKNIADLFKTSESVGNLRVLLVQDVNGKGLNGWRKCVVLTVWGCSTDRETRWFVVENLCGVLPFKQTFNFHTPPTTRSKSISNLFLPD